MASAVGCRERRVADSGRERFIWAKCIGRVTVHNVGLWKSYDTECRFWKSCGTECRSLEDLRYRM
jgi:hypothetical protein